MYNNGDVYIYSSRCCRLVVVLPDPQGWQAVTATSASVRGATLDVQKVGARSATRAKPFCFVEVAKRNERETRRAWRAT